MHSKGYLRYVKLRIRTNCEIKRYNWSIESISVEISFPGNSLSLHWSLVLLVPSCLPWPDAAPRPNDLLVAAVDSPSSALSGLPQLAGKFQAENRFKCSGPPPPSLLEEADQAEAGAEAEEGREVQPEDGQAEGETPGETAPVGTGG